ncbi:MAG TPA: hypothetical protein VJ385_18270 [Fibrobacteria bacterium]|nr:hypothetical protein [Fibrobacteria bacterium]
MKERLWDWWPALPACLILYLGGASFLEKYPQATERRADRFAGAGGPDSLLAFVRKGTDPAASRDSAAADNPFRPIRAPLSESRGQAVKAEPPPRRYVLKGTVGTNVATIANNSGLKQIVKVGDSIDSAEVVSIETNKVVLRDRGGKFELIFQK